MTSISCARKIFARLPKCVVTRNVPSNNLASRTIKIPARYDLLKQAASDRIILNWFDNAWSKTKNTIIDNWESAGLVKKRKPVDDDRKNATTTISKTWMTGKSRSQNLSNEYPSKSDNEILDKEKMISSSVDELSKAKNKAQRHIAEDWDAINRVNSRTNESFADNVKHRATSTIDDPSKLAKEKADTLIDTTTNDIKSKISEKGDDLKQKFTK